MPGDGRTFSGSFGTITQGWSYADDGVFTVLLIVTDKLGAAAGSVAVRRITEDGQVIGTVFSGSEQHVFVWSQGRGLVDLGTGPHGFSGAWVVGINARGDILGFTPPCNQRYEQACGVPPEVRAVLWRKQ